MIISYPKYVDSHIIRSVAISTFTLGLLVLLAEVGLLQAEFKWLIIPLFFDFLLRLIHPKLSPLVQINMLIGQRFLQVPPNQHFFAPKRFAILIGTVLTGLMVVTGFIFINYVIFVILNIFLLVAAYLQGFFDYCIGCEIYDLFIRIGIIKQPNSLKKASM